MDLAPACRFSPTACFLRGLARRDPSPRRPTTRQIRRRRRVVLAAVGVVALGVLYAILQLTVLAPADRDGADVSHLTIHSRDVGADQGVQVVVPASDGGHTSGKPLLVFLHGHGGSDTSYTEAESFFRALAALGREAPVVAFPDG